MLGVAFGVMALTVVLGVTGGFQAAFQERILGLYPHLVVLKRSRGFSQYRELLDEVRNTPGVVAASPATYDDMMIAAGVARSGAVVKGVDLDTVADVIEVEDLLTEGTLGSLADTPEVRRHGGVIRVDMPVAGTWLTAIALGNGDLRVLTDDRGVPDGDRARLVVVDLRGDPAPLPIRLTLVTVGDNGDPPKIEFGATRPGQGSRPMDVRAGPWRLEATGEVLELLADTHATLVLRPARDGSDLRSTLMVEPARWPLAERTAMARLLNLDPAEPALGLTDRQGKTLAAPMSYGQFSTYRPMEARLPGILLGKGLAERLAAGVGSEITLVTPLRGIDAGMLASHGMAPSSTRHEVTGIFESGFHEYDVRLALVHIRAAQRALGRGDAIRWLEVRVEDLMKVEQVSRSVRAVIDPYDVRLLTARANRFEEKLGRFLEGDVRGLAPGDASTFVGGLDRALRFVNLVKYQEVDLGYRPLHRLIDWKEMNTNLFSALKLQKVVLTIFFLIIIIVGSFVVVGSQIMVIHEKTPDIAILKTMGATRSAIRTIFTLQGLLVSGVGTALGLGAGLAACKLIGMVDYRLDASVYLIDRLPVELATLDLILVAGATAICTLAATQYSATKAAQKTPVEGLRAVD